MVETRVKYWGNVPYKQIKVDGLWKTTERVKPIPIKCLKCVKTGEKEQ